MHIFVYAYIYIYIYIEMPLQALTYLSHILGQNPLRVGPRKCPRKCVQGGAITHFGAYVIRVVQILVGRTWPA